MKPKRSSKEHIVYGISLLATCATLNVLDLFFDCPLLFSFLLILGAHALGYAALKILPHYTFWMPPLTALYLSGWYWIGTRVTPHFMTAADRNPDFGSAEATNALWITSLLFCGSAGVIFLVKKLLDVSAFPDAPPAEKPVKQPFKVHIAARVAVYCLSIALVVTSGLCAYFYREEKVAKLEAELTHPTDYTVILPNLQGTIENNTPTCSIKAGKEIQNLRNVYKKMKDISHKDMISATQSYAYGKGDLTVATWTLRHKDSTVNPVRDYAVGDVTLSYRSDPHAPDAPFTTVIVPDTLKQEAIAIMKGEAPPLTEAPENLKIYIEHNERHTAYVTVSFAEHPEISWVASVNTDQDGTWYLMVYAVPEDFDINGEWDSGNFDTLYYPLSDNWKALFEP